MIWAITIITFAGAVVLVLAVFLYYQRRSAGVARRNGGQRRRELRRRAKIRVELWDLMGIREAATTENASHHGLRIRTARDWVPGTTAMVRFLYEDVSVRGRIAYCDRAGDEFAVGLHFATSIDLWLPPSIGAASA